jgi:ornithine carbamoyltransferase
MYRNQFSKHIRNAFFQTCNSRSYTTGAIPLESRHLLSTADLSIPELTSILSRSAELKQSVKTRNLLPGKTELTPGPLAGKSVAMMFSKRSTRTRVSTESAIALLGGHPMFLGKEDIQLGVQSLLGSPDDRSMSHFLILHGCCRQWSR